MFKLNNKGASEVIVVTLIIVISVILAGLFFSWLKESSKQNMDDASSALVNSSDVSCIDAKFLVDSCDINSTSRVTKLMFTNNSDLKIFNIVLTIEGKNVSGTDMTLIGRFEDVVSGGEVIELSTDTNFTYTRQDSDYNTLDTSEISNMVLTNGTCPKKAVVLNCIVN
ncbi:MAG: hypothetical protein WCX82_00210 [archaeon]|jgi:FlaG/FlaF family flagellin (archaellin)